METLCVTGHRPDGLPWGKQRDNTGRRGDYLEELKNVVEYCIKNGFRHFISGAAVGVDTDFAFTVLALKKRYPYITLELAIPCPDQDKFWSSDERRDYEELLEKADIKTVVSPYFTGYCMQKRNRYMVDNSDCVLCCYNGAADGGTYNTVKYAEKCGKRLIKIDLSPNAKNGARDVKFVYRITKNN